MVEPNCISRITLILTSAVFRKTFSFPPSFSWDLIYLQNWRSLKASQSLKTMQVCIYQSMQKGFSSGYHRVSCTSFPGCVLPFACYPNRDEVQFVSISNCYNSVFSNHITLMFVLKLEAYWIPSYPFSKRMHYPFPSPLKCTPLSFYPITYSSGICNLYL